MNVGVYRMRERARPRNICHYHIKAQRILAEARRSKAKRAERVAAAAAVEQTNLMRVHNDTNLNDNARCVCLQD